jgi:uncharacterized protein (DUF1501 family)
MGPPGKVRAMSLGPRAPFVLRGKIEAVSWSLGGGRGDDRRLPGILRDLYANDRLLGPALAGGLATQSMSSIATSHAASAIGSATGMKGVAPPPADTQKAKRANPTQARRLGATLAGFMTQPAGARVAAVEIDGFDLHANQGATDGVLTSRLKLCRCVLEQTRERPGQRGRRRPTLARYGGGRGDGIRPHGACQRRRRFRPRRRPHRARPGRRVEEWRYHRWRAWLSSRVLHLK